MPSFFRTGSESSSDESSEGQEIDAIDKTNGSTEHTDLSRVDTLDSIDSGSTIPLPSRPGITRNNSRVRDIALTALLEEKAINEAADQLGKPKTDPEVQELARSTFQALASQLFGPNGNQYASDSGRALRATAREALDATTRGHLMQLQGTEDGGPSRAVVSRTMSLGSLAVMNPFINRLSTPGDLSLQGYAGIQSDRYAQDFEELDVVGKGGYGKVYKVRHKLDNSFYAVKRIIVSPARLEKIRSNGVAEMENILEEVRSLAKFDHANIVRYHNCWLEYGAMTSQAPLSSQVLIGKGRLLEEASGVYSDIHADMNDLSLGDPFGRTEPSAGIVFEASDGDTGAGAQESIDGDSSDFLKPKRRNRRGSRASQNTVATISSTRTRMSTIESDRYEDDVELIERSHQPQEQLESTDFSQSLFSHSDMPNQVASTRIAGPVLTLNVQMSLYDTNMAAYLSSESFSLQSPSAATDASRLRHCFHPCISLELMSQILSGVQYLHAQGVVHRDLKPANIFLALSSSHIPPSGSVDVSTCGTCPKRSCMHVAPRIGDFGLVAALDNVGLSNSTEAQAGPGMVAKPVGTEFYRPEGGDRHISEKLDVFALGVVLFEMLCGFETRMERVDALTRLRRGEFPDGFAENLGTDDIGLRIKELLKGMVHADEDKRWSCDEVRKTISSIIEALKGHNVA